jgi:hypothetical protein
MYNIKNVDYPHKINNKDNTKAQFIRNYFWGLEI